MTHFDRSSEVRSEYASGNADRNVYLTFDDGPDPFCTPDILDVLADHRVPATFFVIGAYAVDHPKLIRRMIAEGHGVGNHTMNHREFSRCDPVEVQDEILTASAAIKTACPLASLRHVRAPYGIWTDEALAASASAGLAAMNWSVDPKDWSRPGAESIVEAVLTAVRPGAIVLLHDGCPPDERERGIHACRDQTLKAVSQLIPALHNRGFSIRSLPQVH
ncbi:chitooligosaccharide deacetylase NodB [Bradyrhizobium centrolobii]|uniref:Chitooligosaccharide deacetylase n=1 Tax=Bradyrhizobium centrolobii TaxID=1505087 RepID=A0A176YPI1_9BRAD|nr:chitooligosaccharide deacetylase NodB [Bradyrhizobium centrolobii]OAF09201.1 chitooligosaccharide deacetylase NodB [Bradyrhizobium centrolobii]